MGIRRGDRFIGPYEVINSHLVYENPPLKLREDRVRLRNGQESSLSIVTVRTGVVVLPMEKEGGVTLVREFRYAVGEATLEAVSGTIESGETPEQAGLRVLSEQVGLIASEWIDMGVIHPLTTLVHAPCRLFLARNLSSIRRAPDLVQQAEVVTMSLDDVLHAVLRGDITQAASCILILKAQQFLAREGKR